MLTMTDSGCVFDFVGDVWSNILQVHGKSDAAAYPVALSIAKTLGMIHARCGIPKPTFDVDLNLGNGSLGGFSSAKWSLMVGLDPLDKLQNSFKKKKFLSKVNAFAELAITFYHEGRHCEQSWLILRHLANKYITNPNTLVAACTNTAIKVDKTWKPTDAKFLQACAEYLSYYNAVPLDICQKAVSQPLALLVTDPLRTKIVAWHDAWFGYNLTESVRIVRDLGIHDEQMALLMKSVSTDEERAKSAEYQMAMAKYEVAMLAYKNIAYEADAFATEDLVKQEFRAFRNIYKASMKN